MEIAQGFQLFKGEDEICPPLVDDGRGDLFADTDVSHHAAAPLRHAVHFAELDVKSLVQCVFSENAAGKQGPLTADADNEYIHISPSPRSH